jgi:hypothetical protein
MEPLIEVAGDTALFINPLVPEAIARGIVSLLQSKKMRSDRVAKGWARPGIWLGKRSKSNPGFCEVRLGSAALPSCKRAPSLGGSAARCSSRFLGCYFQA